ncbi:MAG: epoxyqueuosine reductase [Deltaproteobacteria bacterium]|nr:epoxyqueuosine reductase [Deltaproteobacteria bacterium]
MTDLGVRTEFEEDPARFLEETVKAYILHSPENRLKDIDGSPIFDEPLVGFADGDDPLFLKYKESGVIGDFFLTPREALEKHLREELHKKEFRIDQVSVISWVLPFSKRVRTSNRAMTEGPSLQWNHGRWHGEALNESLINHIISSLRERGCRAVAPGKAGFFKTVKLDNGLASVWSERHMAYAAGLGTFSLTDALITPKGLAMRCGSVVTDLSLPPSPRSYRSHTANCWFLEHGTCGLCAVRCPAGAITAQGHDKVKCRECVSITQASWLKKEGYIGKYAGCGLCMTGVPCEARIPAKVPKRFIP